MQQGWARQRQVIVKPPFDNDVAQVESIAEEKTSQSKSAGGDAEHDEHISQLPATNRRKTVEEDDPNYEVDRVVQDHTDGLQNERSTEFHRSSEVGLPKREKEFEFAEHLFIVSYVSMDYYLVMIKKTGFRLIFHAVLSSIRSMKGCE
jgi:hypothetical protein